MAIELYQQIGNKLRFELHQGQARAWRSKARFTFVIAGFQGGKTSFLPLWLDREIRSRGVGDYYAVTATFDLYKVKFLPVMRAHFVQTFGWQEDKSDRVFWKREGPTDRPESFTRIILRSASSEGGLESGTGKGAVLDECGQDDFRIGAWDAIQRRLAINQGRVLGGTTPYNLGWLKTEVFDRWRAGDPDYRVIQFPSIINPAFPQAEFDRLKATWPAWKFQMMACGEFTRPAGMIYEDFIDEYREAGGHKVHPFTIPPEWPRWVGADFGPIHTAFIWIARDPLKNIYYLYREYLEGGRTTREHAMAVRELERRENVVLRTGGAKSEEQQRWDFTDAGLPINESPIIDVEAGIDRVIALFKTMRLFIFDTCKGTLDELGTYSRKLDDNGHPTEEIKDKQKFHLLDGLRYDVSGMDITVSLPANQPTSPSRWTHLGTNPAEQDEIDDEGETAPWQHRRY